MKKIYISVLLLIVSIPSFGLEWKQSTAGTCSVRIWSATNGQPITSFDVTSATAGIKKNGTASSISLTASGGSNDFVYNSTTGSWDLELTASNTDTLGRLEVFLYKTNYIFTSPKFDIVNYTKSESASNIAAARGDIQDVSGFLAGKIDAGGGGIPATGGTPPSISLPHIGDATYELTLVSSSYSINEPTISVSVVRSSDGTRLFTKANFTHVVYDDFDIPGVYTHYWKLPISGENLTYGIYIVSGSIDREGTPQSFGGLLNHQGNLEISDTPAAVAFYTAAGEMLEDIMLSRDYSYRAWRSLDVLNRATPGVSSEASIYCPSGAVFGTELRYISPINGLVRKASIMDYDEVMGNNPSNGRWTAIPVDSVTAAAVILGVTLTPSF
jgi:hypothetical protein